jgi:hypothetical protein
VFLTDIVADAERQQSRMRCKNYFQARKMFERLSLSGDPEQRSYER